MEPSLPPSMTRGKGGGAQVAKAPSALSLEQAADGEKESGVRGSRSPCGQGAGGWPPAVPALTPLQCSWPLAFLDL